MKWIKYGPQCYRLVEDNDPRPAVKLKSKKGVPYLKFSPSWRKYEQNYWTPDSERKTSNKTTDRFIEEREHEVKTNPQAKRWEESRKQYWAKNKPSWRKEMMRKGII